MVLSINLSPEIESKLFLISQKIGIKEDELIQDAIINYLEEFEDINDAQERLSNPPNSYLNLEEVEKDLDLAD